MSAPQYDPIGLEAALEALTDLRGDDIPDGARVLVVDILTAYHEAIEPVGYVAEITNEYIEGKAILVAVEQIDERFRVPVYALPGPTEEARQ